MLEHRDALISAVDRQFDHIIDIRRSVHRQPELSFAEVATSALIADELRSLGFTQEPCPTPTGGVFSIGTGERTVMIRADIDALPVQESDSLPVVSRINGVMHACGHDAHVAMALGAAALLAAQAEELRQRFVFVFQPGEEALNGAQAMIEGGLLDQIRPDVAVGCHITSSLPVGMIATRPGIFMAGAASLRITFNGSGGHGAMQPRVGNVVLAAARAATRLEEVVKGVSYEGSDAVCSAGVMNAGTAPNVVPTLAVLQGTLRTYTAQQFAAACRRLEELVAEVATEFAVNGRFEVVESIGPVDNNVDVTALVQSAASEVVGDSALVMPFPVPASDDMGEFLNAVPGSYFFVGAAPAQGIAGMHHSPTFALDEAGLRDGTAVLTAAALRLGASLT